jgi:hypothetical protein
MTHHGADGMDMAITSVNDYPLISYNNNNNNNNININININNRYL